MDDADFLAAIRARPADEAPRLVYADWLMSRGDVRGELIALDERVRSRVDMTVAQLDRLLELASEHGFPRLPDDPCADIFRFTGGGSFPTQYELSHDGHEYYLRWRYGFSIDMDDVTIWEGDLETTTTNEWTFCETNVILAIVSRALRTRQLLSELVFPDAADFRSHPAHFPGRCPVYSFPDGLYPQGRTVELRDFPRWYRLFERRQSLAGIAVSTVFRGFRCHCGIEGLTCGVAGCDIPRDYVPPTVTP